MIRVLVATSMDYLSQIPRSSDPKLNHHAAYCSNPWWQILLHVGIGTTETTMGRCFSEGLPGWVLTGHDTGMTDAVFDASPESCLLRSPVPCTGGALYTSHDDELNDQIYIGGEAPSHAVILKQW